MFKPTHKSAIETTVQAVPILKPIKRRGNSDSAIQAPNYKSETVGSGFTPFRPQNRNRFINKTKPLV